jgi:hypothetical protein
VVPPRSNRVSRAPPYSRTKKLPYPYRAVTVCGAPFQALPVRALWPLAWSAFARRYLRSRCCCPFLRLLRCFSSPGSPHTAMDSPCDTAFQRWVAPFGDPRINGRSPLPSAFRSVPRPSSPLGAKASTRCPSCAAPAPSPEHALCACSAEIRCQRSDVRQGSRNARTSCLISDLWSPTSELYASTAPPLLAQRPSRIAPMLAHRLRIPMPRPDLTSRDDGRTCFTVTTRFTISTEQMSEGRCQMSDGTRPGPGRHRHIFKLPSGIRETRFDDPGCQTSKDVLFRGANAPCRTPAPFDICHLTSVIWMVGLGRFERPTSRLSGVRSDQLSYRPLELQAQALPGPSDAAARGARALAVFGHPTPIPRVEPRGQAVIKTEGMRGRRPGPLRRMAATSHARTLALSDI